MLRDVNVINMDNGYIFIFFHNKTNVNMVKQLQLNFERIPETIYPIRCTLIYLRSISLPFFLIKRQIKYTKKCNDFLCFVVKIVQQLKHIIIICHKRTQYNIAR